MTIGRPLDTTAPSSVLQQPLGTRRRGLSSPSTQTTNGRVGSRFDARLQNGYFFILWALVAIILFSFFLGAGSYFTLLNLATVSVAILLLPFVKDKFEYAILSSPTTLFLLSAYAVSLTKFRPADQGLNAPIEGAILILTFQLACAASAIILYVGSRHRAIGYERPLRVRRSLLITLIGIGLFGMALPRLFAGEGWEAIGAAFYNMIWLGLSCHIAQRGRALPPSPLIIIVAAGITVAALLGAARTPVLQIGLFILVAHTIFARELITIRNVIVLYFLVSTLSVFSDASVEIKLLNLKSSGALIEAYSERLLTTDTLQRILLPIDLEPSSYIQAYKNYSDRHTWRSEFYEGVSSVPMRLSLLPQLDIILPYLKPTEIDWAALKNLVWSSLPSFGQEKDLIYSDRLAWRVGLRTPGNVGRPMITAVGEFYAMGGLTVMFVCIGALLTALIMEYRLASRVLGNRLIVILMFSLFITPTLITTTALSVFATVVRDFPMFLICAAVLKYASERGPQLSRNPA